MVLNLYWCGRRGWRVALMATGLAVAVPVSVQPALAQQANSPAQGTAAAGKQAPAKAPAKAVAKKKADAPKKDSTAAQAEVEAGIAALSQGRAEVAANHLTGAIASGNLPSTLSARALYYRGVAYRRHNKPALAISDLTNALWIKSGLTEEQRADALAQRSAAYREAGLPDQSAPDSQSAKTTRSHGSASAPFAAVAPATPASQSGSGGFFASLFGGGGSSQAPAPAAPTPSQSSTSTAVQTPPAASTTAPVQAKSALAKSAQRTASTAQPIPAPATAKAAANATPVGTQTPAQQASPQAAGAEAGAAGPPKPATRIVRLMPAESNLPPGFQDMPGVREVEVSTAIRPATPPGTVAKSWETATEVKSAPARKAAVTGQVAAGGAVTAAAGKVHVKVAAVRSAAEARDVAKRVKAGYARELGGRSPTVETWNGGNVGTLYIVQIGPFASAAETAPLCTRMRSDGLECRVDTP